MTDEFACTGGGDVAAYALGALDAAELPGFRRHLDTCSICQAELSSLNGIVGALATGVPSHPAPPNLRRAIMADVRADVAAQRADVAAQHAPASPARGLDLGWGTGWAEAMARLRGGGGARPGVVGLAVAVVLVVVVVAGGLLGARTHRAGPRSVTTQVYDASVGDAQVLIASGHGELIVHHLGELAANRTYELWERHGSGAPQPTRVLFDTSASGDSAVTIPGGLSGISELLVTREPAGGTAVPTSRPVVVTALT